MNGSIVLGPEIGDTGINAGGLGIEIGWTARGASDFAPNIEVVFAGHQGNICRGGYPQTSCPKDGGSGGQIASVTIDLQIVNQGIASYRGVENNVRWPSDFDRTGGGSFHREFANRCANPGIGVATSGG